MKENILSSNLQTLIDNVVQNAINNALDRFQRRMSFILSELSESVESAESFESFELFGPSENSDAENDTTASRWNVSEIEFFDLNYDDKFFSTESVIEHFDKNIYYRDVHVFIERIRQMTIILSLELVRRNLSFCLRDIVLDWHISKLIENNRRLLIYEEEVDEWARKLVEKFKKSPSVIMITLLRERYSM